MINSHHRQPPPGTPGSWDLAEKVIAHLASRPDITLSHEESILETGGGVANALPLLGDDPFYVVNGDIIWIDGPKQSALLRLLSGQSLG